MWSENDKKSEISDLFLIGIFHQQSSNKFPSIFSKDMEKLKDFLKLKPFQIKITNWSKKRGNDYPNTISSKNIYISRLRKNVFLFYFLFVHRKAQK
jgi:hypothetical protein